MLLPKPKLAGDHGLVSEYCSLYGHMLIDIIVRAAVLSLPQELHSLVVG